MAVLYEKDCVDIYDIRKAIKAGLVFTSPKARFRAETHGIDLQDYLKALGKFFPTYDKSYIDRDEGLPGFLATVEVSTKKQIAGCFVKNSDPAKPNTFILKTVYEYDPNWGNKKDSWSMASTDSEINPPRKRDAGEGYAIAIKTGEVQVVSKVQVKTKKQSCSTCMHSRVILCKTVCDFHLVTKVMEDGIASISLIITEPKQTSCEGYDSKERQNVSA